MDYFKKHSKLLNKYSEEIKSNIDVLKLFPEEKFIEKTKTRQFYTLENHDNSKAPIGRVLDCKLFYDKEDKQHFVYGTSKLISYVSILLFFLSFIKSSKNPSNPL